MKGSIRHASQRRQHHRGLQGPRGWRGRLRTPATQAELDKLIEERLEAERARYADYDDLKAKAARADETEQAGRGSLRKVQEELDAALAENAQLKAAGLAAEVAAEKKLPAGAAGFLTGSTRDELEASADKLLALTTAPQAPRLASAAAPPLEGSKAQTAERWRAARSWPRLPGPFRHPRRAP